MRFRSAAPLLALVGVTAVWGMTFVQVQDALALYPLFAFLAVRFAISTVVLAPFAWRPVRALPRARLRRGRGRRCAARARLRPADGRARADHGDEHRVHHRSLRRLHPSDRAGAVPHSGAAAALWVGVALSVAGLLLLSGMPGGSALGNALVLGNAVAQSFQIASMERYRTPVRPPGADLPADGDLVRRLHRDRDRARRSSRCLTAGRCGERCS